MSQLVEGHVPLLPGHVPGDRHIPDLLAAGPCRTHPHALRTFACNSQVEPVCTAEVCEALSGQGTCVFPKDNGCGTDHPDLGDGNNECCEEGGAKCGEGEGDCDSSSDCRANLLCGTDNCPWGGSDDCCYSPVGAGVKSGCGSLGCKAYTLAHQHSGLYSLLGRGDFTSTDRTVGTDALSFVVDVGLGRLTVAPPEVWNNAHPSDSRCKPYLSPAVSAEVRLMLNLLAIATDRSPYVPQRAATFHKEPPHSLLSWSKNASAPFVCTPSLGTCGTKTWCG